MFGVPFHFLVVHFPVVLIVGAIIQDIRGKHEDGYRFTLWAAAGGGVAILSGLLLSSGQVAPVAAHAGAGMVGTGVTLVLAMLRYARRARTEDEGAQPPGWLVLELLAVMGILVAAITGHQAVLGY